MIDVMFNVWCFGCWFVGVLCWYPVSERLARAVASDHTGVDNTDRAFAAFISGIGIIAFPFVGVPILALAGAYFGSRKLTRFIRSIDFERYVP